MIKTEITVKNADFQRFEVLKTNRNKRYKNGAFIVEGVRNINGAIHNGWEFEAFLYPQGKPLSRWATDLLENVPAQIHYRLSPHLMEELSDKENASEIMAVVKMREGGKAPEGYSENPVFVLFDAPSNKGNLGTVFRSCDAFGVELLIITGHAVDVYEPEVIRSSMGSFFNVPFVRMSENAEIEAYITSLRGRYGGLRVIGTTAHNQMPIPDVDLTEPVLFLIGNETNGLNRHLTGLCDVMATIPMSGGTSASSLNVACAATVSLYETTRQRALQRGG